MPTGSPRCGGWGIALKRSGISIKWRIFAYFLLFAAMMLVLLWLFQTVFLDSFY